MLHYEMLVDSQALLSNEDDSCMVLVIDFANHSSLRPPARSSQNSTWEMTTAGFTLEVVTETRQNDEILFSYGKRGNGELLFKYGFIEDWQISAGSRSITIELPHADELQDFGEPSFRIGSDDDEDMLSDKDSQYLSLLVLCGDIDVDWQNRKYQGTSFTKASLQSVLRQSDKWQEYSYKACEILYRTLWAHLERLDRAESDQRLIAGARDIDSEKLKMIDAVRDAERKTLALRIQE